jgi:soluble cytochrome b562
LERYGRSGSDRQARRPRAQREGRAADRPGPHRPRGDLRHPRPDAGDDPGGDQAGPLDRQGAKRECDRILGEAREQAAREASQTEIVKLAERQAQEIIDEARRQARETRLEMEDWADGILSTLEVNLDKFLSAVKRGRERLHERSQETVTAGVVGNSDEPY